MVHVFDSNTQEAESAQFTQHVLGQPSPHTETLLKSEMRSGDGVVAPTEDPDLVPSSHRAAQSVTPVLEDPL